MEDLNDLPLFKPTHKKSKLAQQWDECKEKQPDLLPKLAEIARKLQARGYSKYSISGLFHILRWETDETTGDLGLKVNNNHQPFAARELMETYPELKGFFKTREQKPFLQNVLDDFQKHSTMVHMREREYPPGAPRNRDCPNYVS